MPCGKGCSPEAAPPRALFKALVRGVPGGRYNRLPSGSAAGLVGRVDGRRHA